MVWVRFRIWIRNWNQKLSYVGTGSAKNHYGSTTPCKFYRSRYCSSHCWGSVTFWSGSGSRSSYPYLWIMDPDPAPDPTPFFSDFKDALNLSAGTLSSVLKLNFLLIFCVKILFCNHYLVRSTPLWEKGRIWIRTCTSDYGSRSGRTKYMLIRIWFRIRISQHWCSFSICAGFKLCSSLM